jgi:hypothetical protein
MTDRRIHADPGHVVEWEVDILCCDLHPLQAASSADVGGHTIDYPGCFDRDVDLVGRAVECHLACPADYH